MIGLAFFAALAATALAHPGEHHDHLAVKREIAAREHWAHQARSSLSACSNSTAARRFAARNAERRATIARTLRQKRGITSARRKRDATDLAYWEAIDHNKTGIYNYTTESSAEDVFGGVISAILSPTVTDGPYYIWGEGIRSDVVEDLYSEGVPLHLEVQYYDIETCEPIPDVYVDIWNCNATGVYSGVSVSGNYASGGYNSTYLRGIQSTDSEGVVQFDTIFPGHYDGRATHTHLLSHMNVTVNPNNTLLVGTGTVTHIGQLFWNEVLRTAVEAVYPYNTNTQAVVSNADDMWSVLQADSSYDPFPEFLYLGADIDDGLFAWKQIGLNTSADWTDDSYYSIAGYITAEGGYANADSTFAGGSGGGNSTGNGTAGGAAPSGSAASSVVA